MSQEKAYNTRLFRDFAKVRPVVRALCLRGSKDREEYKSLAVAPGGYDGILAKLKFALQEQGAIKVRNKGKSKINYFYYQPWLKQDNPLAELWRFAVPDRKNIFFYLTILESLSQESDGLTKEELMGKIGIRVVNERETAEGEIPDIGSKTERIIKEMQQLMLIREIPRNKGRAKLYGIESDIWREFTIEELEEVYIYLDFIKNVMPFELPYYLLQKHLELYFWKCKEEERLQSIKSMFLFRHRNPVNILESEMMYYFLRYAGGGINHGKDAVYQKKMRDFEMSTPRNWDEETGLPIVWFHEFSGPVDGLEYDCYMNGIYKRGKASEVEKGNTQEESGRHNFVGADLFALSEDTEEAEVKKQKALQYAKLKEEIRPLFHEIHGVYFENIFKLWEREEEFTVEELFEELFCNKKVKQENGMAVTKELVYWDSYVEEELLSKEELYQLFSYDKISGKYRVRGGKIGVPIATRIQREALKSLEELEFTKYFLAPGTIQKIGNATKDLQPEWSVQDIVIVNQEHRQMYSKTFSEELQMLLGVLRSNQMLADKKGNYYIPLRLQYSLRYDEFRVLVVDKAKNNYRFLMWKEIDFTEHVSEKELTWEEKESLMKKTAEKLVTHRFNFQYDWHSAYMDNIFSDELLMFLSVYDKETDYTAENPDEESGKFAITVRCWEDDESDILEGFEKLVKNKGLIRQGGND